MSVQSSKAYRYVTAKGWPHRVTDTQIQLETCPVKGCSGWHFYLGWQGEKDMLWSCFKCGSQGSGHQLRRYLGDEAEPIASLKDAAASAGHADPLPNVAECHARLMAEGEDPDVENSALDYLVTERGFSMAAIEKFKLGLTELYGKRWLVYPYFDRNGAYTFAKMRSLPPAEKDFVSPKGREAGLFNEAVLTKGLQELVIVEGEADAVSAVSNGVENVVGVPGASIKKATWITKIDEAGVEKIYLTYDNDRAGVKGAREIATRIGLERCFNLVIPDVEYQDNDGEIRRTKDIGEWFRHGGGTLEGFEKIKAEAKPFPVEGVQSVPEAIAELREDLITRGSFKAKFDSPWASLNKRFGGMDDGDMVGILAPAKTGKTTVVMNWLDYLVREYKEPAFLYCLEMKPKRLIRKWAACVTDTADGDLSLETLDTALGIAANYEADYLFGCTASRKLADVVDTIKQTVRRYGVKFVAVDNLQMIVQRIEHTAQEISMICKTLKALAMELNVILFLIIQPHRVKDGEIASAANAEGSSAPEKDCDGFICFHRNKEGRVKAQDFEAMGFLEVDESFGPAMLARVDLSRYSSGGVCTLHFDGAKSKVTEMPNSINPSKPAAPSFFQGAIAA